MTLEMTIVGKTCPYCLTPFKTASAVITCTNCGIPHHQDCWQANGGCTTYGCAQGAPARAHSAVLPAFMRYLPREAVLIGVLLVACCAVFCLLLAGLLLLPLLMPGEVTVSAHPFMTAVLVSLLLLCASGIAIGIALLRKAWWARGTAIAWFAGCCVMQGVALTAPALAGASVSALQAPVHVAALALSVACLVYLSSRRVRAAWQHAAVRLPFTGSHPVLIIIGSYLLVHALLVIAVTFSQARVDAMLALAQTGQPLPAGASEAVPFSGMALSVLYLIAGAGVLADIGWLRRGTALLLFMAALSPLWGQLPLLSSQMPASILACCLATHFAPGMMSWHLFDAVVFIVAGIFLLLRPPAMLPSVPYRTVREASRISLP